MSVHSCYLCMKVSLLIYRNEDISPPISREEMLLLELRYMRKGACLYFYLYLSVDSNKRCAVAEKNQSDIQKTRLR